MVFEELSNEQWSLLAPALLRKPLAGALRRGRPRIQPRVVANAVLWVLTTGESWSKLPARYPSQPTCRCRFEEWRINGQLADMIRILTDTGRSISYVPECAFIGKRPEPAPTIPPSDERGLPRVIWRTQASWQASQAGCGERGSHVLFDVTAAWMEASAQVETAPAQIHDEPHSAFWMGLAAKGARIVDERGYVVYVAADLVPDAMFRGWTEITRDAKRVARSGLVGPRFTAPDAAMQCALTWAHRWIELHGAPASGDW